MMETMEWSHTLKDLTSENIKTVNSQRKRGKKQVFERVLEFLSFCIVRLCALFFIFGEGAAVCNSHASLQFLYENMSAMKCLICMFVTPSSLSYHLLSLWHASFWYTADGMGKCTCLKCFLIYSPVCRHLISGRPAPSPCYSHM